MISSEDDLKEKIALLEVGVMFGIYIITVLGGDQNQLSVACADLRYPNLCMYVYMYDRMLYPMYVLSEPAYLFFTMSVLNRFL